jgi:starvation-inducible DNA-binding protein
VQLGGTAEGTVRAVAKRSQMPDYPLTIAAGREHVEALARAIAWFGENIRKAIDQADEVNDKDTADLFTEVSRSLDKDLWFVEAHLQAER